MSRQVAFRDALIRSIWETGRSALRQGMGGCEADERLQHGVFLGDRFVGLVKLTVGGVRRLR